MKFTQEDLLNAMGLKVGDTVSVTVRELRTPIVGKIDSEYSGYDFEFDRLGVFGEEEAISLDEIIINGFEYSVITPPKYTLTETEKNIVLAIDEKWKWIAVDKNGDINLFNYKPVKLSRSFDYSPFDNKIDEKLEDKVILHLVNILPFIQWSDEEPVSLDELREIAKK